MSVGHIARLMEEAGTPTIIIASDVFQARLQAMSLPRMVLTPFPMGRPLGAPGDAEVQRQTLEVALALLESATEGKTVRHLALPYRPKSGAGE